MKNILSYNCIRKPKIIQRHIIDSMELRSAEIRSHTVIRRTSKVYSLCVFRLLQHWHPGRDRMMSSSSPPSYFTVVPPAPNQSSSHVIFKSSLHVVFESSSHVVFESSSHVVIESSSHVYSNPRHMLYSNPSLTISTRNHKNNHNIIAVYKCRITSPRMPDSTVKSSIDILGVTITSPQEQSSWQWQKIFITAEPHVVVAVYPLLGPGSGGVRWCYVCVSCESGFSV